MRDRFFFFFLEHHTLTVVDVPSTRARVYTYMRVRWTGVPAAAEAVVRT